MKIKDLKVFFSNIVQIIRNNLTYLFHLKFIRIPRLIMATVTPQLSEAINNLKLKIEAEDLANNNRNSEVSSEYLFDSQLLLKIKPESFLEQYNKFELVQDQETKEYGFDLGDELFMRPLKRDDFKRNYLGLLAQLTKVGDITQEQFEKRFDEMAKAQGTYYTFVIVDKTKDVIAGMLDMLITNKTIHCF